MSRTKVDSDLAAAEQEHDDDPERKEVITRARRFKSSWIELAESLTSVRRSGRWKHWGYESFDVYAKSELHLRQETVDKLTGSFLFLQKRAPEVLSRDGVRDPIPSYQAVDFLRRAQEQPDAPVEAVREIQKRVLEDAAALPTISRQFKDTVFPLDPVEKKQRDVAAVKNVATRLRDLLGETRAVPKRLASEVASSLEKLLEALGTSEEEAA